MATSQAEREAWENVEALIRQNRKELKRAETYLQLKEFAEEHDLLDKEHFSKFKHCLKKLGIFYDDMRTEYFEEQNAEKAKELDQLDDDAPTVFLWSGAVEGDKGKGSFAIVDDEREVRWYGDFFKDDRIRVAGDLVSAEQSAADKAVFLAAKAFEAAACENGRVEVETTCPDLDIAALKASGVRLGVAVSVTVSDDERAVVMAEQSGYMRWNETDLSELVVNDAD